MTLVHCSGCDRIIIDEYAERFEEAGVTLCDACIEDVRVLDRFGIECDAMENKE